MKRFLTLIFALLLTVCFASCGGQSAGAKDLDNIKEAGVIRIGMECNYKPFNWTQNTSDNGAVKIVKPDTGKYAYGYDVMIAKKIAEALGVKLEIYMCDFDGLITSLNTNVIDAVIAGMSPTEERKKAIDFSSPYYSSNLVIVTKKNSALKDCKNLNDLNKKEYKIAAQIGTFHLKALKTQLSGCTYFQVDTFATLQAQLANNVIDGYVAELPTALTYCSISDEYTYVPLVNNTTGFKATDADVAIAIGLRKGSTALAKINECLNGILQDQRDQMMSEAIRLQSEGLDL